MIGVDDIEVPYWMQVDRGMVDSSSWAMVTAVPRVLVHTARQGWATAPALTAAMLVLQVLSGVVTAFGLLSTANVFTRLLSSGPTPDRVLAALPAIALVAAAYAAGGLLDAATGWLESMLAPRIERHAQDALFSRVVGVDLIAHDDPDFTELISRASGMGLSTLRSATTTSGDLLASLVSVVAAMATAGILHPLLAPVVLLSVAPQAWATIRTARINYRFYLEMSSRTRRLWVTAGMITSRSDAAEVRAVTAQDVLLDEHRRIATELMNEAITVQTLTTTVRLFGRTLAGVGAGLAYLVLGALIYTTSIPLALAGAAALALRTAASAVSTSIYAANRLYEASFYLDLYRQALIDAAARTRTQAATSMPMASVSDAAGTISAGTNAALSIPGPRISVHPRHDREPAPAPASVPTPRVITLDGVSFTYPGQERPAVADVSLTLRAGETLALVGENGSGKSTLAKLLCGLYLPTSGTVSWDGVDLTDLDPRAILDQVALVLQHPAEWPMTAANNIRIGRINAPDPHGTRLAAAAARSGADTVLAELPRGADTMLSRHFQTGRDLSGGQWQRLSVARGLYRDAPLVIADEPTAAMDARAEHTVFHHLHDLGNDPHRITVLITHRLANVRSADHIAVLDHGRLTEHGTHHDLTRIHDGTYADLFALQAASYEP